MAATLSPQNREKIVMTDALLSFVVNPVQYTGVRLSITRERGANEQGTSPRSHSEMHALLLCS